MQWAQEQGAVFVEAGAWLRAAILSAAGRDRLARDRHREVEHVRSAVGVCDVSTLGKIDIQGARRRRFLDRLYINTFSTLPVGKARYGLMLREDGFVMDDGTTSRLADDRYFMTTTTANAAKVMQHLEFCHQVLWPELDVQMVSVTEQWAQFSIAGPRSRDTAAQCSSTRSTISPTRPFRIWRRAGHRDAADSRRGSSASPSPANSPTSSRCPRATATR